MSNVLLETQDYRVPMNWTEQRKRPSEDDAVPPLPQPKRSKHTLQHSVDDSGPLLMLPADVVLHILSFLDARDVSAFASCGRDCRRLSSTSSLWMNLFQRNFQFIATGFCQMVLPGKVSPRFQQDCSTNSSVDKILQKFGRPRGTATDWRTAYVTRSVILSRQMVSCPSLSTSEAETISKAVSAMGGTFSPTYSSSVTVVIAMRMNSQQSKAAVRKKVPIVRPQWLFDCAVHGELFPVEPYVVAPLAGLVLTVTGLSSELRLLVCRLARQYGAVYTPALHKSMTSHLLACHPEGEKFSKSIEWGMKVVNPKWFFDCVVTRTWLDESAYLVLGRTPTDTSLTAPAPSAGQPNTD